MVTIGERSRLLAPQTLPDAYRIAAAVPDPELPQLTLEDLGILREVSAHHGSVTATITPTYSGCPALREISHDLRHRLSRAGYHDVVIRTRLSPPWTSDWITETGRAKLAAAGIAPPEPATHPAGPVPLTLMPTRAAPCPHCGSANTRQTAPFSGTACKSLNRCQDCQEPFEAVKSI